MRNIAIVMFAATTSDGGGELPPRELGWVFVDGRYWQLESDAFESPELTDAREGTRGHCPMGMVEVRGAMKVSDAVETLQDATCTEWLDTREPRRCAHYDADRWRRVSVSLPTKQMRFCIDRYEYPNRLGANPALVINWRDSRELCAAAGARLCTEAEWTFACEGEEALPYPYGYDRDVTACVADRPWRPVNERAIYGGGSDITREEIARLWQGEASGARARCKSVFGVYDLTGNVDEWTTSTQSKGLPSIMKGGYWAPVRTRCRPSTRSHGGDYVNYQQGFRCCRDALDYDLQNVAAPPPRRL